VYLYLGPGKSCNRQPKGYQGTNLSKISHKVLQKPDTQYDKLRPNIRLVLVLCFGGTYFDSDVISVKPLPEEERNFVIAVESDKVIISENTKQIGNV
jgi:hypothetical protein